VGPDERERWSKELTSQLLAYPAWRECSDVAAFVGRIDEPDTMPLLRHATDEGKRLWLPRVIGVDPPTMEWVVITSLAGMTPGRFGILEPKPGLCRAPGRVGSFDLVLIPGLAFDRRGARLGAGYGYYDRALESVRAMDAVHRVGVCFDAFFEPAEGEIPVEDHDVRMHAVCTECGVFKCE
jgi:5-formyltetrahydrofolate cyclo-ligase